MLGLGALIISWAISMIRASVLILSKWTTTFIP